MSDFRFRNLEKFKVGGTDTQVQLNPAISERGVKVT